MPKSLDESREYQTAILWLCKGMLQLAECFWKFYSRRFCLFNYGFKSIMDSSEKTIHHRHQVFLYWRVFPFYNNFQPSPIATFLQFMGFSKIVGLRKRRSFFSMVRAEISLKLFKEDNLDMEIFFSESKTLEYYEKNRPYTKKKIAKLIFHSFQNTACHFGS